MDSQIPEDFGAFLETYTPGGKSGQQSAIALAPVPELPQLGNYNIDLDGAHPSLFDTSFGQNYLAPEISREQLPAGHAQDFFSDIVNPESVPEHTGGLQDTTEQSRQASFSSASEELVYTPYSANGLRELSPAPANNKSLPPPPPAINPDIFAGALQIATTAGANETHPAPSFPQPPFPLFPLPQQQQLFISPTPPTNMYVQESLSDYPHLHRTHHTSGYADGMSHSRYHTSQPSFDDGYPLGQNFGMRAGKVLGILEMLCVGATAEAAHELLNRASTELNVGGLVHDFGAEIEMQRLIGLGYVNTVGGVNTGNPTTPLQQQPQPPHPAAAAAATIGQPQPPPQPETIPPHLLPHTLIRMGPPKTFNFHADAKNIHAIYHTDSELPNRLTAEEALTRWEWFARRWMGTKARMVNGEE